jgi:alkanesulfonate monooxygenase SsuD/methylene tetrahydromethanopterin reductase-like flavin-dependent oxidoreductase (luciferase family)
MSFPRVGIQLPEVERDVRWPEYVAMAHAAESSGFESIWVGDHHLYRGDGRPERGPWEAWTLLSALAAVTERVRLGPLVACLGFHPPGIAARMAATVDEVSAGRFVFGLGAGWNETEFEAFDIPLDERAGRFEEAFAIVRDLLRGERVTIEGRFHRAQDAVLLPVPARAVPLMVGSTGPRVLRATLPTVDAWNTWFDWYGNRPEGFAEKLAGVHAICEQVGRDPATLVRSACLLVKVGAGAGERPDDPAAPAVPADRVRAAVAALGEAGADEVVVVADPIDERSIREIGAALAG